MPRIRGVVLELAAQLDDEVVDGAVGRVALQAPDLLEDLVARDRLVAPLVEQLEQLDLVEGQGVLLAFACLLYTSPSPRD